MPYITQENKDRLDNIPLEELWKHVRTVGELTYCIYKLMLDYKKCDKPSYSILSESTVAAECAKLEFYRRWLSKYEDQKIEENGDVL